ncbi:MAG TPA: glutathione S-transferase C-terminal domain-containing protein [Allosphingosinicella sp.]|jgi:glutathione S-transferase|nr:glutathione S-transferase C-terminal domain-containing protein [Allosphingosinicella sp.]
MADPPGASPLTLLTFAPMVDSETTRLLLHYYGIPYRERDHLFAWVSVVTLLHGGTGKVPLLYGRGLRVTSPRSTAEHFDAALPPERKLIPEPGPLRDEVEKRWQDYNGGIGADMAVFAYYHLLPEKKLMAPVFAAPVPRFQAMLVPVVYPLLRGLFSLLLKLGPERAEQAFGRIKTIFDQTAARLADGRRYAAGDRLTLADIGLAGASAPLLLPPGYGTIMPAVETMPPAMRAAVEVLRAHPTGAYVRRLYEEDFAPPA